MSSPDELRSYAVDCARLARPATDPLDKARLLNMARAWSDLADRIEKIREVGGKVPVPDEVSPPDPPAIPPVSSPGPAECGGAAVEDPR